MLEKKEKNAEKMIVKEYHEKNFQKIMKKRGEMLSKGERGITDHQERRQQKLRQTIVDLAAQRLVKEEIVRENLARQKRMSAYQALTKLAKDHHLAKNLKEKAQSNHEAWQKKTVLTQQNLKSQEKEAKVFNQLKNLRDPRNKKHKSFISKNFNSE